MASSTTLDGSTLRGARRRPGSPTQDAPALVIVWSAREGERVGELLALPERAAGPFVFGRGAQQADDRFDRLFPVRQQPGENRATGPLENPFLSRQHLAIRPDGAGLAVENLGKRPLLLNGQEVTEAVVRPGALLEVHNLLLLLCVERPPTMSPLRHGAVLPPSFGEADDHGIVGESPLAWELRDQVAFFARRSGHVLVTGESGTGKELVAQAIHRGSGRKGKLVARNAATLPPGLIDAELFGNAANYPNAGMPERPGLVGEADGGTLFLDEIGELPRELQTHLLRVLDAGGEYQRLGESRRRTADLRVVAATNRDPEEIKHDLLARLGLRLHLIGLNERREDIPLLARHVLRRIAVDDPDVGERFFDRWDGRRGEPRIDIELARALVEHTYATHLRELEAILWKAIGSSRGEVLELTPAVRATVRAAPPPAPAPREQGGQITPEQVRAALEKHGGVRENAWRDLGLPSRHALHRLIKKYGIEQE